MLTLSNNVLIFFTAQNKLVLPVNILCSNNYGAYYRLFTHIKNKRGPNIEVHFVNVLNIFSIRLFLLRDLLFHLGDFLISFIVISKFPLIKLLILLANSLFHIFLIKPVRFSFIKKCVMFTYVIFIYTYRKYFSNSFC